MADIPPCGPRTGIDGDAGIIEEEEEKRPWKSVGSVCDCVCVWVWRCDVKV